MTATVRRLEAEAPALRRHRAADLVLTLGTAAAVVAQAVALAALVAAVLEGTPVGAAPVALATAAVARAGLGWARATLARRTAATAIATLRRRLLARVVDGARAGRPAGEQVTTLTSGLDALEPYCTGHRPAVTTAAVVPAGVLVALAVVDPLSALVVAATLPLVPVFGALVGAHTRDRTARQWGLLARLGGHFLDAVAGLPTLRAFGRAGHQVAVVRRMADEHRHATMRVLRVAFLSALVLELVATLSVALVAVPTGLRLLDAAITPATALSVLLLAPEAFLPLRGLGAAHHDAAGGLAVADRVFADLDRPSPPARTGSRVPPDRAPALVLEAVTVRYDGRDGPALDGVRLDVSPGERVGIAGPSGAGKSTLLAVLLGLVPVAAGHRPGDGAPVPGGAVRPGWMGRVLVDGVDLADLDPDAWRARIAWVPQRPHLFATTVAANIRLGRPGATDDEVRAAARAAHADGFVSALPDGYATVLGERGTGLSAGQRQRVALARAFLRDAPLLLLDEPTAHLDARSEEAVVDATRRLTAGRTALVVAHRPALLRATDRVVRLDAPVPVGARP